MNAYPDCRPSRLARLWRLLGSLASGPFRARAVMPELDMTCPAAVPAMQDAEWSKPWWMERHEEKLRERDCANAREIELVMLGDSLTQGWEQPGRDAWERYFGRYVAINLGIKGDRTEHVLWRLANGAVDGLAPKVVVLCIGTNNTGQRVDPALETAAGIKAIVDDLRARLPTAKIILMAIFPCQLHREPVLFGVRNDEVNAIIRLLADRDHVRFLDLGELYRGRGRNLDRTKFSDGLHLSAEGYECWAAALKPLLVRLLGDR